MRRRILKEIENMEVPCELDDSTDIYKLTCTLDVGNKSFIIEIFLDINIYPFKPPKNVTINGYPYIQYLSIQLLTNVEKRCMCCHSLLCGDNWQPMTKVKDLLNEIIENINKRNRARELLCARVISRKHLFPHAPLHEYL